MVIGLWELGGAACAAISRSLQPIAARWSAPTLDATLDADGGFRLPTELFGAATPSAVSANLAAGRCPVPSTRASPWARARGWAPPLPVRAPGRGTLEVGLIPGRLLCLAGTPPTRPCSSTGRESFRDAVLFGGGADRNHRADGTPKQREIGELLETPTVQLLSPSTTRG